MARVFQSATRENYVKLLERYDVDVVAGVARSYVDAAIANPKLSVKTGWSISCLPSTNRFTRLFTINVGAVEGAYMWKMREDGNDVYLATVYVDTATLERSTGCPVDELADRHGNDALIEPAEHTSFLGRATRMTVEISGRSIDFPKELPWKRAAAALADQLVNESACAYGQYHNPWLAEHLLATDECGDSGVLEHTH